MKFIKVQPFPASIAPGAEYVSASYPGAGVYIRADQLFINNGASVFTAPSSASLVADSDDLAKPPQQSHGISEDTLLRALAIVHEPSLAADLLGRK